MINTPNVVRKLEKRQLNALSKLLADATYKDFVKNCIEAVSSTFNKRKPTGNVNEDYYQWGYLQGIIDTHDLYGKLDEYAKAELKNRIEAEKNQKALTSEK